VTSFKIKLFRQVSSQDVYDYVIDAVDLETAMAQARLDAAEFNSCCPDGVLIEQPYEIGSWQVDTVLSGEPDEFEDPDHG
jgi:hypothetical protein